MPPSDQEPRYQLVDSNGNVVGSLFGDGSGNVVIADETDTQTTFGPDGITTPALEADKSDTRGGWTDVSSSRSFNTTETNDTGSDLDIQVVILVESDNTNIGVKILESGDDVVIENQTLDTSDNITISATIANGADYTVEAFPDTSDISIFKWSEQS